MFNGAINSGNHETISRSSYTQEELPLRAARGAIAVGATLIAASVAWAVFNQDSFYSQNIETFHTIELNERIETSFFGLISNTVYEYKKVEQQISIDELNLDQIQDWATGTFLMSLLAASFTWTRLRGPATEDPESKDISRPIDPMKLKPHKAIAEQVYSQELAPNKAIAEQVNSEKLKLKDVIHSHGMKAVLSAIPYIHHLDLVGLSSEEFTEIMQRVSDTESNKRIKYLNVAGHDCESLPELPKCVTLSCCNCPLLSNLPALPNCQALVCSNCPCLRALPELPNCNGLWCFNCPDLQTLPALLPCLCLDCSNCPSLRALPELPKCLELWCSNCPGLRALPALLLCQKLDCSNCPSLSVVSSFPYCKEIHADGSPIQSILQQPAYKTPDAYFDTHPLREAILNGVFRCRSNPGDNSIRHLDTTYLCSRVLQDHEMYVLFDALSSHSEELLVELARTVTKSGDLPMVHYLDAHGQQSEAFDAGAVGRDFFTRVIEAVISSGGRKTLGIIEGLPHLSESRSAEAAKYFEAMGVLMALCCKDNSRIKTGPLFAEKAYEAISYDLSTEEGSILAYVNTFAELPSELSALCSQEAPNLDTLFPPAEGRARAQRINELLTNATYLMEAEEELSSIEAFNEEGTRLKLREALLQRSQEHTVIKALTSISKGMKAYATPDSWRGISQMDGQSLAERTQGKLSADDLIKALEWSPAQELDPDTVERVRGYMHTWIQETTPETLSSFMRAVTGARTLVASRPPRICLDNTEQERLPVAQSCFFRLDMSANYSSQERFNEAMKEFLVNALDGTGFQRR
jgi:hypothetical protein